MAHYDDLYEDITEDEIKEKISNAERRIDMYKERVSEMEADLNRYALLNKTSRDILQNAKEQDELAIRVVRTSVEKMTRTLERVLNGEKIPRINFKYYS
ncbi:hypothetical protein [Bacillus phage SBSphiJ6]|nr:hypothetical protein [Bacillus phage SBSphiJ1]UPI12210.1 hypothetical protein [Bacillus phage SBSphiJ2]UPI12955.1 hypothetical protein [Bacillus phage SBSphiJ5]UPI13204.1 hypothetical protein [Bacillus phage SBSphiJ6]